MHPPPPSEYERACRTCRAPVAKGAVRCSICGGVEGPAFFCPYCRIEVDLDPSSTLRFVCTICGRARVPLDDSSIERSFAELPDLQRANKARLLRPVFRLLSWMLAGSAALVVLLSAALAFLVGDAPVFVEVVTIFVTVGVALALILAMFFAHHARRCTAELTNALDDAWLKVAMEFARAQHPIDVTTLARAMRLDEEAASKLWSKLPVSTLLGEPDEARWLRLERELPTRARIDESTEIASFDNVNETFRATRDET